MITTGLFTSNTPEWSTPQDFFGKLDEEFHFDLDVCATPENAKCKRYFTKDDDGLSQQWGGRLLQSALRARDWQMGQEMLRVRRRICNVASC